tara:strand:- start:192 stop:557 length:366 start_codon:yes stop_codon:yes gene_type:complete
MKQAVHGRWGHQVAATLLVAAAGVANGLGFLAEDAEATDLQRGQMLYETQCQTCHDSVLHLRKGQQAQSFAQIEEQVRHWAKYQNTGWSDEDVGDVSDYLNSVFYRYPCPDATCSLAPTKG